MNWTTLINISLSTYLLLGLFAMPACKKDSTPDIEMEPDSTVYVAGFVDDGSNYIATVWKNGVADHLTDGSNNAIAQSVYVSGGDIYVGGYENIAGNNVPTIWKNRVADRLTDGAAPYADVRSLYVSEGDVYAVGFEQKENGVPDNNNAIIWTNGVPDILSREAAINAFATSVFVAEGNVFVAGAEKYDENYIAMLWKNGNAIELTDGTSNAFATSVIVEDGDVYVTGNISDGRRGVLWKNGAIQEELHSINQNISPASVFVDGSDIYITGDYASDSLGTNNDVACVWKNGTISLLTDGADRSSASAIIFSDEKTYTVGHMSDGTGIMPMVWVNGTARVLADAGSARSIFIKN